MTRSDFRGAVAAPRPRSAWVMSIVASSTLWITEQLPLWLVAIQLVNIALLGRFFLVQSFWTVDTLMAILEGAAAASN